MATFGVFVCRISDVYNHPDADKLTIVKVNDFTCISNKLEDGSWRYQKGDLVAYIPEHSILPNELLKKMGFWSEENNIGTLAGAYGNRIKATKLRGVLSQGLLYPVTELGEVVEGQEVSELLGIKKYEPEVPKTMGGEVLSLFDYAYQYDIENILKYPTTFEDGEEVIITEKLHGTFFGLVYVPGLEHDEAFGNFLVASKGLLAKGMFFKNIEKNDRNVYVQMLKTLPTSTWISTVLSKYNEPVYIFSEIFGKGIQDLQYGQNKPAVRCFDVRIGLPGQGRFLPQDEFVDFVRQLGIETVPLLYRGPYSNEIINSLKNGRDSISGSNIREGIVIKPTIERSHKRIGRIIMKAVSEDYLLRKNGTEFQ